MDFNSEKFRKDIILHRSLKHRMGMRECALQIGISAATLSRLEVGNIPDLLTYIKVCKWMKKSINNYVK